MDLNQEPMETEQVWVNLPDDIINESILFQLVQHAIKSLCNLDASTSSVSDSFNVTIDEIETKQY